MYMKETNAWLAVLWCIVVCSVIYFSHHVGRSGWFYLHPLALIKKLSMRLCKRQVSWLSLSLLLAHEDPQSHLPVSSVCINLPGILRKSSVTVKHTFHVIDWKTVATTSPSDCLISFLSIPLHVQHAAITVPWVFGCENRVTPVLLVPVLTVGLSDKIFCIFILITVLSDQNKTYKYVVISPQSSTVHGTVLFW